jgi:hypothetical protein
MVISLKNIIGFSGCFFIWNSPFAQNSDSSIVIQNTSMQEVKLDSALPSVQDSLQYSFTRKTSVNIKTTLVHKNEYGDLLNDDPEYNKKSLWPVTALRVAAQNGLTWLLDKYVFKYSWSDISPQTWKQNLRLGWEWDNDRFGVNFVGHPYAGSGYFNIARSNGYSYLGALPFAIEGSLMWEYFGETSRPSYNDLLNTSISGLFLGEVLYRLSSNILDDRTRGSERVFREIFAGVLDPARAVTRIFQGKMFKVSTREVYQKDRLNISLWAGIHKVNEGTQFWTGPTNETFNIQLDYGNPFEQRQRKPFDLFRIRSEIIYGGGKNSLDNITGYGILFGKNLRSEESELLVGGFQHYDYWNNKTFELGSIGLGGGIISKTPITSNSDIYTAFHLAVVPLAGNSTRYGPDSSKYRDYNFGGGIEGKVESTVNLGNRMSLGLAGYYYWIHTYVGNPGNSLVGILKPRFTLRLFGNLGVGFEQHYYFNNRTLNHYPTAHITSTEQKLFLQLFLEDGKRRGKYH